MGDIMRHIKIFEASHELDLEDDLNAFLLKYPDLEILKLTYQVALCYGQELEYSFSVLLYYDLDE